MWRSRTGSANWSATARSSSANCARRSASAADVTVVGDRFVVPTDILFDTGSAELAPAAQDRLDKLALRRTRKSPRKFPRSIDWVLRIDGHTDKRPIHTTQFPSNWELSTARAVAIVKYLVVQGIPAHRLSANGFGQFQPLDNADTPAAMVEEPAHRNSVDEPLVWPLRWRLGHLRPLL